jgi:segregation and condensation protein A
MEKLIFQVAEFDAPLDLILHLLSRHKINILDIDISSLLAQYMAAIESWREVDLEVSSEFLEMASRLVYIKTVSLLPKHEEETEKLRQELTGQLIEYRLCKLAAEQMGELSRYGGVFVRPPMELEVDLTYTLTHPAAMLYAALCDAMGKGSRRLPPPAEAFEPLVARPVVSVTSKIFTVLRALRLSKEVGLDKLFTPDGGRSSLIATFLAVLELIKSGKICLDEGKLILQKKNP